MSDQQCVAVDGFDERGIFVGRAMKPEYLHGWSVYVRGQFVRFASRSDAEQQLRAMGAVILKESEWV